MLIIKELNTSDLIKSPLNYVGGKYKLLPQILPLFPKDINTFVDLFCGGCNVGINVKANNIICNDLITEVIEFCNMCKNTDISIILDKIHNLIEEYNLSRHNKEGFNKLREDYNLNKTWDKFYTLVCHSFSNQIRFNKKGEFNLPFGKRTFNPELETKFITFIEHIKHLNIDFINKDFRQIDLSQLNENDFVYIDPPYLFLKATYNENGGWTLKDELDLLELLDNLNNQNVKFALSNVFESNGKINENLKEWSQKYNINHLNSTYNNCNYQRKDKIDNSTVEVLITNYKI